MHVEDTYEIRIADFDCACRLGIDVRADYKGCFDEYRIRWDLVGCGDRIRL